MVGASTVKVQWANGSYRLQGRVSLSSTYSWEDLPYTSPYIFNIPGTYQYFRLVCP